VGRVLLISYSYPPRPEIGSVRLGALARYLPQFGWEPIVLTAQLPDGPRPPARVIETPYRDVLGDWKKRLGLDAGRGLHDQLQLPVSCIPGTKRLHSRVIDWVGGMIAYPDPMKGWIPCAIEAVRRLVRSEKVDAILSSAHPPSCHLIGRSAKEILGCPWVADFRDLWTQHHYYSGGWIRRTVEGRLERKTISCADALVTVSDPWAELLRQKFREQPVYWVTNGFDPDEFSLEARELTKTFSISHTGQLYQGKRDPTLLLEVAADLIRIGAIPRAEMRIRFYGPQEPGWLPDLVQRCGLGDVVESGGLISRTEALAHQQESQLLLLLVGPDAPEFVGHYPAKIFEYLGSKRPIIALGGPSGVVSDLLRETNAGIHIKSGTELRAFLIAAYRDYQQLGRVSYAGDGQEVCGYPEHSGGGRCCKR
jgi:glycosyltransferase involved in cell wall biosynthesis